jgi:hypothetical protein
METRKARIESEKMKQYVSMRGGALCIDVKDYIVG